MSEEYVSRRQRRAQPQTDAVQKVNASDRVQPAPAAQPPRSPQPAPASVQKPGAQIARPQPSADGRGAARKPALEPAAKSAPAARHVSGGKPAHKGRPAKAQRQNDPKKRTPKPERRSPAAIPAQRPSQPPRKPRAPELERKRAMVRQENERQLREQMRSAPKAPARPMHPEAPQVRAQQAAKAKQPPLTREEKLDRQLRRRLRHMREVNSGLRAAVAMMILILALVLPASTSDDMLGAPAAGNDNVVLPISLSTPTPVPTALPTQAPVPTPQPTPTAITISAAGDCTLGYDPRLGYTNSLPHELERQDGDYGYFFRDVKPVFEADDITVVNLECAFTKSDDRQEDKTFCFKGDPLYRNILVQGSIEVVSLGNNHTRDYKTDGFNDTVEALRLADIGFAVNGISHVEEVHGAKVGFLSYRNHTPETSTLKSDIASLREQGCAIVICSFHWGEEYRNVANSTQTKLGRAAVDYGADLVLGHHPHVIGSIEQYNGKYIVYSLGNFCFGGNRNPEDKDSFIFRQTFQLADDGTAVDAGIEIVPCRVSSVTKRNDYQPTVYGEEDAKRVLKRLNEYSRPLKYGVELDESVLNWDW